MHGAFISGRREVALSLPPSLPPFSPSLPPSLLTSLSLSAWNCVDLVTTVAMLAQALANTDSYGFQACRFE